MKQLIAFCSLIFTAGVSIVVSTPIQTTVNAAGAGNYVVNNSTIVKDGAQIMLKGINWFGMEGQNGWRPNGLQTRDYKNIITQMKSLGFNAVRMPFCPATLHGQTPGYIEYANGKNADLAGLKSDVIMDKIVAELNRQEMFVIVDMHSLDCQTLGDLWYQSWYPQQYWINDWKVVAQKYAALEYFVGFDLKNEPVAATWGTGQPNDWKLAIEAITPELLTIAPNKLIFAEGVHSNPFCSSGVNHWYGGNLEPMGCVPIDASKVPTSKLVFSPHVYGPDVYNQPYFDDYQFPNNLPAIYERDFGFLHDQGYAIALGEWGGKMGNQGGNWKDPIVQSKLAEYLRSKKICNTFWWSWNPESGDTGGILQDDGLTPWQNKIDFVNAFYNTCQQSAPTTGGTGTTSSSTSTSVAGQPNSIIKIYAAGTPAGGVYPNIDVLLNDAPVSVFTNVRGNPDANQYLEFTYNASKRLSNETIKLRFSNDAGINGEDRNLKIDKLVVDGKEYLSEQMYSVGTWTQQSGNCAGGFKNSKWLHCNGYFEYKLSQPTPPVSSSSSSSVVSSSSSSVTSSVSSSASSLSATSSVSSSLPSSNSSVSTVTSSTSAVSSSSSVSSIVSSSSISSIASSVSPLPSSSSVTSIVSSSVSSAPISSSKSSVISSVSASSVASSTSSTPASVSTSSAVSSSSSSAAPISSSSSSSTASLASSSSSSSSSVAPLGSIVTVYAAGTPKGGVYPTLDLKIDGQKVATFSDIRGDATGRVFQKFVYQSPVKLTAQTQRELVFTNDESGGGEDRNVRIDKMIVDTDVFEAESPNNLAIGSWSPSTGCGASYAMSEWLHCPNASMTFNAVPSTGVQQNILTLKAAGTSVNGVFPTIEVLVKGASVGIFEDIRGNATTGVYVDKQFFVSTPFLKSDVVLKFTNDISSGSEDRNVRINSIGISNTSGVGNGVFSTLDPSVYSEGSWNAGAGCGGGNKQSEWLHCPNAFFKF